MTNFLQKVAEQMCVEDDFVRVTKNNQGLYTVAVSINKLEYSASDASLDVAAHCIDMQICMAEVLKSAQQK